MAHSIFPVRGGSKVAAFIAAVFLTTCAQQQRPSQPEMTSTVGEVDVLHDQRSEALFGGAEVVSFLSFLVSAIAALYARSSVRASTLAAHMSAIVQVESRLAELPAALRFHGLSIEDLKEAGIDKDEFAYLLNSFTLGSIRQKILARWNCSAFPSEDYRYQMCLAKETRRAWPLVKKLMNPSAFVDRIDRTIEKIEKQEALSLLQTQSERV